MRVDKEKEMVAFDNMQNRGIKGTTEWQRCDVVLDVPKDATAIALGILLDGQGEVWLNSTQFEVVGPEVAVTSSDASKLLDQPLNLNFEQ